MTVDDGDGEAVLSVLVKLAEVEVVVPKQEKKDKRTTFRSARERNLSRPPPPPPPAAKAYVRPDIRVGDTVRIAGSVEEWVRRNDAVRQVVVDEASGSGYIRELRAKHGADFRCRRPGRAVRPRRCRSKAAPRGILAAVCHARDRPTAERALVARQERHVDVGHVERDRHRGRRPRPARSSQAPVLPTDRDHFQALPYGPHGARDGQGYACGHARPPRRLGRPGARACNALPRVCRLHRPFTARAAFAITFSGPCTDKQNLPNATATTKFRSMHHTRGLYSQPRGQHPFLRDTPAPRYVSVQS